jgi:hypothetical protein
VTFDIEKCYLRYRTQSISIHDIERKNLRYRFEFDIEDFDIEYFVRYRASDTRFRGAKDPDEASKVVQEPDESHDLNVGAIVPVEGGGALNQSYTMSDGSDDEEEGQGAAGGAAAAPAEAPAAGGAEPAPAAADAAAAESSA